MPQISNYGTTWVESNMAGSNLRTLYIAGNSEVILQDKFAITFGAPGVNSDIRPIYVGPGSTLNLNNATLIVRIDSRNLRFGVPYYLIQTERGVLTGRWGGLERGYLNPDISVDWYNATDLGENSAVIFRYSPGGSAGGGTGGGSVGGPIDPVWSKSATAPAIEEMAGN